MAASILVNRVGQEELERSAFMALPKHAILVDRSARVCASNAMAARLARGVTGCSAVPDQWGLSDVFDISPEAAIKEIIVAASGGILLFPLRDPAPGSPSRMRFRVSPVRNGGAAPRHFVLVSERGDALGKTFRDLNAELEHVDAEARRERAYRRSLQRANEALNASNAELKSFAYAVSHDLKSPVQTVAMLLSEMSECNEGDLGDDVTELVDMSRETLSRMSVLIEDLLRYTQLIGTYIRKAPCDLNAIVDEVIADLRAEVKGAGATVRRGDLPVVLGDAVMLRVLFQNLVSNAVKFRCPDRPPEIMVESGARDPDGRARIEVRDNGIGIAPEYRDRIFELFNRLHRHEDIPGSGLGLTMCRRIVHNLKGGLEVGENPGGGSVFTVSLRMPEHE